jgi:A/G-specific adenine glycosylase
VKPTRRGTAFVAVRGDGAVLLERRPGRGLLGGMLGLPGGGWDGASGAEPPFPADWREVGAVRHTFTHFHLDLAVAVARVEAVPGAGAFYAAETALASVPSVMRKALALALAG